MNRVARLALTALLGLLCNASTDHAAAATGAHRPWISSIPCTASLPLSLTAGQHWPGSPSLPIPHDLPSGAITLHLPLYPGATVTREAETQPSISYPAVDYMKSASALYRASASIETV